jgi:hypothetical protein
MPCRRRIPPARLAAVASVLLFLAGGGPARSGGEDVAPLEPALVNCLARIESAFRAGDALALRDVLPNESRVLVGLESFSRRRAYYAPDQVIRIFQQIFEDSRPIRFQFDRRRGELSRGDIYYVPAFWAMRGSGPVQECRLQFMVRKEGPGYLIREIKELR